MDKIKGLNEVAQQIHKNNVNKGFYDEPKVLGETLLLIIGEILEGYEAIRQGKRMLTEDETRKLKVYLDNATDASFKQMYEEDIKGSYEEEIADTIIRLLDHCGHINLDIETHILAKVRYNTTRPYKHGKQF